MERVDVDAWGINQKLARKYNAIVNHMTNHIDTVYEDGCINDRIKHIEYMRKDNPNSLYKTNDYIKITTSTFDKVLWVNNPNALTIDRKYNCIVKVANLEL